LRAFDHVFVLIREMVEDRKEEIQPSCPNYPNQIDHLNYIDLGQRDEGQSVGSFMAPLEAIRWRLQAAAVSSEALNV
jgi:hypothetical protein